jgi:Niemann-Pick C1 protein
MATVCLTGVSVWGNLHLRQEFDQMWFIPKNSYLANYTDTKVHYYPEDGQDAAVYMGRLNYSLEFRRVQRLVSEFKKQDDILHDVKSWSDAYYKYMLENHKISEFLAIR